MLKFLPDKQHNNNNNNKFILVYIHFAFFLAYSVSMYNLVYVALRGTPGALGVPLPWCSCLSTAFVGNFGVGELRMQCVQSASSYLPMLHC